MPKLHSWTDDASARYYSGQVSYSKTFDFTAYEFSSKINAVLDFGSGMAIEEPNPLPQFSMKAYFEGPLREAAEVYVNGERAGFVWHPPYTLTSPGF